MTLPFLYKNILGFIFLLIINQLAAQKAINNQYGFKTGIYTQVAEFQQDAPKISFTQLSSFNHDISNDGNQLQVPFNTIDRYKREGVDLNQVWGISINKKVYIRVLTDTAANYLSFIRLHTVGKLCYYYYTTVQSEPIAMGIFDPLTQKKIAEKTIFNKKKTVYEKFFTFAGAIPLELTRENLEAAISDDKKLSESFAADHRRNSEFLFKTLLIYNERNPIFPIQE